MSNPSISPGVSPSASPHTPTEGPLSSSGTSQPTPNKTTGTYGSRVMEWLNVHKETILNVAEGLGRVALVAALIAAMVAVTILAFPALVAIGTALSGVAVGAGVVIGGMVAVTGAIAFSILSIMP